MVDCESISQLIDVIRSQNCDRLRELLATGVDPNSCKCGLPALFFVKDQEVLSILLSHGVKVDERASDGSTVLHFLDHPRIHIARYLLDNNLIAVDSVSDDGESALFNAIRADDIVFADLLINRGADVNLRSKDGCTPLHVAAFFGRYELVEHLLSAGADGGVVNSDGETPLHCAVKFHLDGDPHRIIAALCEKRVAVNSTDGLGLTPLYWAIQEGLGESVAQLVKFGGASGPIRKPNRFAR